MPDVQHAEAPLADKQENVYSSSNFMVPPGFGLDTQSPGGGLYIGQVNAKSLNLGAPVGTGDLINAYDTSLPGTQVDVRRGGGSGADQTDGAPLRVSRFIKLASGTESGDGAYAGAGIIADVTCTALNVVPPTAINGRAKTTSTAAAVGQLSADAIGGYFVGWAGGASIHKGIGLFLLGRNGSSAAGANSAFSGLQVAGENLTANDAPVVAAGFSGGPLWITAGNSTAKVGAAIELGNSGGGAGGNANAGLFDVGLHINGQVANSNTGSIATASIQDDSHAATSIQINGTHATAAITVASGAGKTFLQAAQVAVLGAFAAGDHYVIADASGNLHLSSLGPAS